MTFYSKLSEEEKARVDREINAEVPYGERENTNNGFKWMEPQFTLSNVHSDDWCAECWRSAHTCLCSHDS